MYSMYKIKKKMVIVSQSAAAQSKFLDQFGELVYTRRWYSRSSIAMYIQLMRLHFYVVIVRELSLYAKNHGCWLEMGMGVA